MLSEFDENSKQSKYSLEELLADYNEENREITYEDTMSAINYLASVPGSVTIVEKK